MPVNVYVTHQISQETRLVLAANLEAIPFAGPFEIRPYQSIHQGLSPSELFQALGRPTSQPFFVIANKQTIEDISNHRPITVLIVAAWENSAASEKDLYRGSINLDSLLEADRLSVLRGLAEERATHEAEETADEWFWEPDAEQRGQDAILWQIKSVRADMSGTGYICGVYEVKDVKDMHRYFKKNADQNGGVFRSE